LRQLAVRLLCKTEIVDALDGNFLCDRRDCSSSTTPVVVKVALVDVHWPVLDMALGTACISREKAARMDLLRQINNLHSPTMFLASTQRGLDNFFIIINSKLSNPS